MGRKTLIVNFGTDKGGEGTMFSALLCTKSKCNNTPKSRRPIAFMFAPARDNSVNIQRLLNPIRKQLELLKDNSCILSMRTKNGCIATVLTCFEHMKTNLDRKWRRHTKYSQIAQPTSRLEAEEIKQKAD